MDTAFLSQVKPSPVDTILDVGCGTGSLLVRLGQTEPLAMLIGIDPDPAVLARARIRLAAGGFRADVRNGFARQTAELLDGRRPTEIVSSLMFIKCR
ncbi:class I SAM-dependent methyltransferase [Mesorhizobium comanense]|uniref:class I SAM-dependent methyltransferase n=1 Tax=Mesorhizobium comanense TaxID=2502215 RepID=UPI0010F9087C|nr:class I SAM-dependent methyltransferase [Mesorhizobium comanense]